MKNHADLELLIKSAETLAAQWQGKEMPEAETLKYNELMREGASLSEKLNEQALNAKTMERMRASAALGREVPNPTLPAAESKSDDAVVGYITPGDLAVMSEEYARCISNDGTFRKGVVSSVEIKGSLFGKKGQGSLISLTESGIKALRGVVEQMKSRAPTC
jgi:hypothetical protein